MIMKKDDFLEQLIQETCKDSDRDLKNDESLDLNLYFEKQLNRIDFLSLERYLNEEEVFFLKLNYIEETQCYRLTNGSNLVLDFPSNWSVFSAIKTTPLLIVKKAEDQDYLCDIFSEAIYSCEQFALTNDSGDYRMVIFQDTFSSKKHCDWMRGYFDKKNIQSEKTAA